jgi:photosynthetic reaction center H subunit
MNADIGAITGYIDVAQLVLYAFWLFFFGLVYYLRQEDKREGYPLTPDPTDLLARGRRQGYPPLPAAKRFLLPHGGEVLAPGPNRDTRVIHATPVAPWAGAPLEPTGDPMVDGVGPAAWAERHDEPDLTIDGAPKIVPIRVAQDFFVASEDPDPRGMPVIGADGVTAGTVVDVWIDRAEYVIRYLEVDLGERRVLLPLNYTRVSAGRREVRVASICGRHFASVPGLRNPDRVTFLEEDKICAFYAGGYLYATPDRMGPLL